MFSKAFRIFLSGSLFLLSTLSLALAQGQIPKSLTYKNALMGIEIRGPEDWFMHEVPHTMPGEKPERLLGVLVDFTLVPFGSKSKSEDFPIISLETESAKDVTGKILGGKTPLEYANYIVEVLKELPGMMDVKKIKIIEEPNLVKIKDQEGARYIYEMKTAKGNSERNSKELVYVFMKGDLFYSLEYTSKPEYFDKHTKEFEAALNTFVLK